MTAQCSQCKTAIATIHMDCPNCGWWNGYYLFNYSKEAQELIARQRAATGFASLAHPNK